MIGERVRVTKRSGEAYFGIALRWESADILVVKPEEGGSLEKRAFLAQGDVVQAGKLPDPSQPSKIQRYKSMVEGMSEAPERIKKYTKMTEGMDGG